MFYSQGSLQPSKPQSQQLFMLGSQPENRSRSTSLPSFNELLTSIPLTHDFTSASRSASGSSASSSPSNYYSQPMYHPRMPNLSPPIPGHQTLSPSVGASYSSFGGKSHYQYQSYAQPLQPLPVVYSSATQPAHGHAHSGSIDGGRDAPALIRSTSSPIPTSRSSSASPLQTGSPELEEAVVGSKDAKRKHVCKVCARSFTTSGHLARHNRVHTGERKHVCPWPTCDARFARQDNCMQHYKTHTKGRNKRSKLNFKSNSLGSK
ncbi:uncharacterized protein CANTADRAFT_88000 [Suhomyces tanzawaensis NRRL Y-17324]|uniref:C2H2-type domain-containing protein n=1 Tax=Suhomyces tanzawaensis NRRL Y-17324 TaxID=984487 RepID=A0A1E4SRM6_9ASCO|nr:uncharacterized protein CANTADRAFT_88000 [Suhomyces tanzawaensis NRRL Y-17324]ODV82062.1 hypothetical protein CANTADRAFT_88000 [Suhomyces tanzawaensis NRRL Y-17324]